MRVKALHVIAQDAEQDPKPLIISACVHGKSDSWATKATIQGHIERARLFKIIARGVEPQGKPHMTPEGLRGVELTLEEIRHAVLILIHSSNAYLFRRRFGDALTSALDTAGILYERQGIECQHLDKNTGRTNAKIADCCKIYRQLLDGALRRAPAEECIHQRAFELGTACDAEWHRRREEGSDRRRGKRKGKR